MKYIVSTFFFASSAMLMSCASGPVEKSANANSIESQKTCEVSFSMLPHKKAINKLGQSRLDALEGARKTFETEQAFIESFDVMTAEIIKTASGGDARFLNIDVETVFGGYEGFTSPSLSARFEVDDQKNRAVIENIGAALGYVYLQDSVLIQCDVLPEDTSTVFAYDMTEAGRVDAVNPSTLKSIYGMMIGEANGNLDLGFSYYESEDRFSVLGFDKNGKESNALDGVAKTLKSLTQNDKQVSINKVPKWVDFPSNDWAKFPNGQSYLAGGELDEVLEGLNDLQKDFISSIDERLAQ